MAGKAAKLYDNSAPEWVRTQPTLLSDFTARPRVLELCEPVEGSRVLDLGCGEGYCTRQLVERGAQAIVGLDISEGMIERARNRESSEPLGIRYTVGSAIDLSQFQSAEMDLVLAVFLFNYLDTDAMQQCMTEVARVLRPGGRFVFSSPHPLFPYVRPAEPPFYFSVDGSGYFSGRNRQFHGRIWKRDGSSVEVQLYHKTYQDYFDALKSAGFCSMPTVEELHVTEEMLKLDEAFFGPLVDIPLHIAVSVVR